MLTSLKVNVCLVNKLKLHCLISYSSFRCIKLSKKKNVKKVIFLATADTEN